MQKRNFGKNEVSIIGFGAMRLPMKNDNEVDEQAAIDMIRYAIDNGINYVDTAYVYHGGKSEVVVGKALKDGYRQKTNIATKLPCWLVRNKDDMYRLFNEQLNRLQTDYIDYYLLHSLNSESWEKMINLGVMDFVHELLDSNKIKHIGFSFHDDINTFKKIIDYYNWDFCQIQLNILDEQYQAGLEGLRYAKAKNIDVIIMEPLRGGGLANHVPNEIIDIWKQGDFETPAEGGLKYLWNYNEISVVLSGMSNMEQLKENIKYSLNSTPNMLSNKQKEIISMVKDIYTNRLKVNCTGCKYCMPCPNNVNIPECFRHYNNRYILGDEHYWQYNAHNPDEEKASKCLECGACEKKCPQHIKIIQELKNVVATFGK